MSIFTKFCRSVNLTRVQSCSYSSKVQYQSLSIANIDWSVKKVELHNLFSPYGPIENLFYPQDRLGRYTGKATIILRSDKAEQAIAALNSYPLENKDLHIRTFGPARDTPFPKPKDSVREDKPSENKNKEAEDLAE